MQYISMFFEILLDIYFNDWISIVFLLSLFICIYQVYYWRQQDLDKDNERFEEKTFTNIHKDSYKRKTRKNKIKRNIFFSIIIILLIIRSI